MLSAQIAPGLRAARELLAELGVELPLDDRQGALALRLGRASAPVRPFSRWAALSDRERARRQLALEVLDRSLNRSLAFVHPAAYLALTAQYARFALSLARRGAARACLLLEGWLRSLRGSSQAARCAVRARPRARAAAATAPPGMPCTPSSRARRDCIAGTYSSAAACLLASARALARRTAPINRAMLTVARYHCSALTWYSPGRARASRARDASAGWPRRASATTRCASRCCSASGYGFCAT